MRFSDDLLGVGESRRLRIRFVVSGDRSRDHMPWSQGVEWVTEQVMDFFGTRPARFRRDDGTVELWVARDHTPIPTALADFLRNLEAAAASHQLRVQCDVSVLRD